MPRKRDQLLEALIDRLPDFDGQWSPEIRDAWWRCWNLALAFIGPEPTPRPKPSVYDWFLPTRGPDA